MNSNRLDLLGNTLPFRWPQKAPIPKIWAFLISRFVVVSYFGFLKLSLYLEFGGFLMYSSANFRPVSLTNWMSSSGLPTAGE